MRDTLIDEILRNEFPEDLLGEDFTYLIDRLLNVKERQLIELLIEGYTDDETYKLLKSAFNSKKTFFWVKHQAKKKILAFLGA